MSDKLLKDATAQEIHDEIVRRGRMNPNSVHIFIYAETGAAKAVAVSVGPSNLLKQSATHLFAALQGVKIDGQLNSRLEELPKTN